MPIRVAVCGAAGRMGGEVASLVARQEDMILAAAVEAPDHESLGRKLGPVFINDDLKGAVEAADVTVDFSSPQAALKIMETCRALKSPLVIGTTGLSEDQMKLLLEASKEIPLFHSPNMALGVNLVFRLVREAALGLPKFDVEIVEMHHRKKRDAPSGTALRILHILKECCGDCKAVFGREGMAGEREEKEIGIHSLRGGDVVGVHTVLFSGEGETLEITHRAGSRKAFAYGTLKAVRFVVNAGKGLFGMDDLF